MLSKELQQNISDKIGSLHEIASEIPGVIVVHSIPAMKIQYMSPAGLNFWNLKVEELDGLGTDYFNQYLNIEDVNDYLPRVMALFERNNPEETVSYFQQVRRGMESPWEWYFSTSKIMMQDVNGNPILSITNSLPVDPQKHVNAKLDRLFSEFIFHQKNKALFHSLTSREKEILKLLALSFSASEIAEQLIISQHTVETHRKNLRKKLGINTTYELTQFARGFDLI